ncbi:stage II sporulation protein M [Paraliomyxa miuraensis]|uniref:stage II sporulation protein M n=1 Tax=Paraliomyxa miuraensis TaxID=376150 RepID=UPI002256F5E4|nr:stage II sporulation protein M [Paraliomyxa miuraensis]MCX4243950.1 stage II sporulation protein M [Paraliomyxa miuraensis]
MHPQDHFVAARKADWQLLDVLLTQAPALHRLAPASISRAGALYRSLCSDLMRARSAGYDTELLAYLDGLAARAHNMLYGARPLSLRSLGGFVAHAFPRALRANGRFFAIATLLFVVPLVLSLVATLVHPEFAPAVLPQEALDASAESYAEGLEGRESGSDATMAGFYVYNNVGIAFRCFATGVLFGLGSMFFLVYNGVVIGTVLGWVIVQGHGTNILTFVCGHGAFELTAICIAGGAGLQMGYALVRTEGRTRLGSLRAQAPAVGTIVGGAAIMLAIAAAIEGFWSPSGVPAPVKWTVAGGLWLLVIAYLALAGRRRVP